MVPEVGPQEGYKTEAWCLNVGVFTVIMAAHLGREGMDMILMVFD